ncbi:Organic cation transporter protein [Halotydeus destructor]|nr:Organic cation transporter protein [Halotydeus destructor]
MAKQETIALETAGSGTTEPVKQMSDIIGHWGKWQRDIAIFVITCQTFSAFNGLSSAFYAPNVAFTCADGQQFEGRPFKPLSLHNDSLALFDSKCSANISCDKWVFDRSVFELTIIEEWNLVCDRSWIASLTQSVYMAAIIVSALLFGYLSDIYGRKVVLWIVLILEIVSGLACAFSPSILAFTVSRFFQGLGCYGRNLTAFLLAIECVGSKYRAEMGIAVQLGWAAGYVILPWMAFYVSNFRNLLILTTVPEVVWLAWLWFIPESPRWQLVNGRQEEAKAELLRALKLNGKPVHEFEAKFTELKASILKESEQISGAVNRSFLDLWKTKQTRVYSAILYVTWFVNAFVYYGISLNIGDFGGDLFWNFFIAGAVEFPSYFFCMYIMKHVGRRPLLGIKMYGAGFACLAIIFFVGDKDKYQLLITVFAMIGKFCITSSFGIIYVYSAEIYPTVLRQVGVGSCSVAGRFGSIIAPFIKELNNFTSFGVSMTIFGVLSIFDGVLTHWLPETRGTEIPDTMEEYQRSEESN